MVPNMPELSGWWILALTLVIFVTNAGTAGLWLTLGGLGGQRQLLRAYKALKDDLDRVDERITREVRARAGQKGQEKRQEARSLEAEARDRLEDPSRPLEGSKQPPRPSLIRN